MHFRYKLKSYLRSCIHHLQWSLQPMASVQIFFNAKADIKITGISFISKEYASIRLSVAWDILASYMWRIPVLANSTEIVFLSA